MAAIDPATLVVLDETSTHTSLVRTYGRSARGTRVVGAVPRNHGPNVTCLAALRATGIVAPLVVEGAVDGAVFVPWLTAWLLPRLAPGTTIICDNLSVHKHEAVRPAVEAAGCRLEYLPASSPDLNPIELIFAKLKTHLRAAASRTYEALVAAIGTGFDAITTADTAGCYRHCGYPLPEPETQPL
jgi:transposase